MGLGYAERTQWEHFSVIAKQLIKRANARFATGIGEPARQPAKIKG